MLWICVFYRSDSYIACNLLPFPLYLLVTWSCNKTVRQILFRIAFTSGFKSERVRDGKRLAIPIETFTMLFFSLSNWYIQRQLGKRVNRCVDAGGWWVCKCQSESKHKAYKAAVVCLYKIRRMKSKQTEWQHRQRRKYPECNQCYTFSIESISICSQQQSNGWFSQNWFYAFVFVFRNR